MPTRKSTFLENKIFMFALLLVFFTGCQSLTDNFEVVVADRSMEYWALSPESDKIIYRTNSENKLLFPQTGQENEINCDLIGWLDNSTLLCARGEKRFMLLTDNSFEEIPFKQISTSEISPETILSGQRSIQLLTDFIAGEAQALRVRGWAADSIGRPILCSVGFMLKWHLSSRLGVPYEHSNY